MNSTERCTLDRLPFRNVFFKQDLYPDTDDTRSGINYWPRTGKTSMPMKIYLSPAIEDGSVDSLKIDYDIAANRSLTHRPLLDEIRQIPNSNLYIGKMYYRVTKGLPALFLWFALELNNKH